jgi:hypothetical protein
MTDSSRCVSRVTTPVTWFSCHALPLKEEEQDEEDGVRFPTSAALTKRRVRAREGKGDPHFGRPSDPDRGISSKNRRRELRENRAARLDIEKTPETTGAAGLLPDRSRRSQTGGPRPSVGASGGFPTPGRKSLAAGLPSRPLPVSSGKSPRRGDSSGAASWAGRARVRSVMAQAQPATRSTRF